MNTLLYVHACTFQFTHAFVATAPPMRRVSYACDMRGSFKLWVISTVAFPFYKVSLHCVLCTGELCFVQLTVEQGVRYSKVFIVH